MVPLFCGSREHAYSYHAAAGSPAKESQRPIIRASAARSGSNREAASTSLLSGRPHSPHKSTMSHSSHFHPVSWAARPITNREETRAGTRNSPTNEHLIRSTGVWTTACREGDLDPSTRKANKKANTGNHATSRRLIILALKGEALRRHPVTRYSDVK